MLLDVTKEIVNLDGVAVRDDKGNTITISSIIVNALLTQGQNEQVSGAEKMDRWELAGRIHKSALPVEVSNAEAEKIKSLVDKTCTAAIYPQIVMAIDRASSAAKKEPVNAG